MIFRNTTLIHLDWPDGGRCTEQDCAGEICSCRPSLWGWHCWVSSSAHVLPRAGGCRRVSRGAPFDSPRRRDAAAGFPAKRWFVAGIRKSRRLPSIRPPVLPFTLASLRTPLVLRCSAALQLYFPLPSTVHSYDCSFGLVQRSTGGWRPADPPRTLCPFPMEAPGGNGLMDGMPLYKHPACASGGAIRVSRWCPCLGNGCLRLSSLTSIAHDAPWDVTVVGAQGGVVLR